MKEVEKKDTPEIAGGEVNTFVMPPVTTYPIQPVTPEQPMRVLIIPESPLP
jgi:hypothetical protein